MEIYNLVIDGLIVPEYCVVHNIPFNDVLKRFRRMRSNPNKKIAKISDLELVKYIIRVFYKNSYDKSDECKFKIGDKGYTKVARENNILPVNLRGAIIRGLNKNPNASVDAIANRYIQKRKRIGHIYTCEQRPLKEVCSDLDLRAQTAECIFREQYPKDVRDYMTQDEIDTAFTEIVYCLAVRKANKRKK